MLEIIPLNLNTLHDCHFSIQLKLVWMLMTAMAGLTHQVEFFFFKLHMNLLELCSNDILLCFPFWLQLVGTLQWKESFLGLLEVQQ